MNKTGRHYKSFHKYMNMSCCIFHIQFLEVYLKNFILQKLFIMTQPTTLLCQQKYVGMVNLNFKVFHLKW